MRHPVSHLRRLCPLLAVLAGAAGGGALAGPPPGQGGGPAAPAAATAPSSPSSSSTPAGPTITVDPAACQWLARYQPAPDVAYQPGVDVDGNPVVPADLDGGHPVTLPPSIPIPITARLARLLGGGIRGGAAGVTGGLYRADPFLGVVTLDGDRVLFNGQPVDSSADAELAAVCQRQAAPSR